MNIETKSELNIFPHITYIVDRKCTPDWKIPHEKFSLYNIILLYDGEAFINNNGKEFHARRGDILYFKPNQYRSAHTSSDNPMQCYAINFDFTCPTYQDGKWKLEDITLPFDEKQSVEDVALFNQLIDLFDRMTKIWLSRRQDKAVKCNALFIEILNQLIVCNGNGSKNYSNVRRVEIVIQYMVENFTKKIKIKELSDCVHVSPSYLDSMFRDVTGKAPIEYLISIRLNKAKQLLREGYSICETTLQSGFSDIYFFSRYFKKVVGVSPSEYKNATML